MSKNTYCIRTTELKQKLIDVYKDTSMYQAEYDCNDVDHENRLKNFIELLEEFEEDMLDTSRY